MSTRLGEAHYRFTIDDADLVAGLKRARAAVRIEAAGIAADMRRIGLSFDAVGQRAERAAKQAEGAMQRIRRAQLNNGAALSTVHSVVQGRRQVLKTTPSLGGGNNLEEGRSSRLAGAGKLANQLAETFSSIGSGMSPIMVALKNGPQLLEAMAQAGLRLGPVSAIVTALAGALLVLGANALRTERDFKTFSGQIEALAHGSAYNAEALTDLARAIDIQGASADEARQAMSLFMREGVHPERLNEFGLAATYLSQVMGMDVVGAATAVSAAFTGNYDDVVKLDEGLHFLTESERAHIKTLFESGKASDARNEAFRIFTDRYASAYSASLTEADKFTRNLSGAWETLVERIGNTTAIQAATNAIGDLVDQLATWMLRFIDIKRMTQDQLMTENKRLTKDIFADTRLLDKMKKDGSYGDRDLDGIQWGKVVEERIARNKTRAGEIADQVDPHNSPKGSTDTVIIKTRVKPPSSKSGSEVQSVRVADNPIMTTASVLEQLPEEFRVKVQSMMDRYLRATVEGAQQALLNAKEGIIEPPKQEVAVKVADRAVVSADEVIGKLKDIPRLATPIKDAAFGIGSSFADAFGKAAAGMTSFEDAFKSTLKNLIAKWAASGIERIFGMMIGGNAAKDAGYDSEGIFGRGSGSTDSGDWISNLMSIFSGQRAAGGTVTAGNAYIVGERRAELFVPNVSGFIQPSLMGAGRGGGNGSGGANDPIVIRVEVDKSPYFNTAVSQISGPQARLAGNASYSASKARTLANARQQSLLEG